MTFSGCARSLIDDLDPVCAYAQLSGLLIGLELSATQHLWGRQKIVFIGSKKLLDIYTTALKANAGHPTVFEGYEMALAGLGVAKGYLLGRST